MNFVLRLTEAAVEFLWWGLQSHFHVQPNNCVEVVLRCVVVGVVTKIKCQYFVEILRCGPHFLYIGITCIVYRFQNNFLHSFIDIQCGGGA